MNKKNFAIVLLLSIAMVNNVQSMDDRLYRDYVPEDFDPLVEQADRFAQAQEEEALNNLLPSWEQAVTDNDINQVSDILYLMRQNGISVSAPLDSEGNTALMLAALARRLFMVQLIFDYSPTGQDVQNVLDRLAQGQRFPNDESIIETLINYRDGIYQ